MPKSLLTLRRGQEKFDFLYIVISAVAFGVAMTYSLMTGLGWLQTTLLVIGMLIGALATVFCVLEVRRLAQTPEQRAGEILTEDVDPYLPRTVVVAPPTGDAQVHHEYYPESAGLDQGQLTSSLRDQTPLFEKEKVRT